ncbi:YHYH domain-containing protein [Peribacillus kribbensis]|uniref:YHYH domain-containing protein n=1 Tax=Peribacillus kribbensis TaxID=356658 RepID=UPI0012DE7705|nr:YHYH domain-containing protein [Peribacillus kribbensis]
MRKIISFCAVILIFFLAQNTTYAHPGRTDAKGGHTCHTNCAKWGLQNGEYHYHNGASSSSSSSSSDDSSSGNSSSSSNYSFDKDCSDFSSYDEVVEYWNSKGYSATNDPERLDGWGNTVDDGIPCEVPSDYDTSKINNSPAQMAAKEEAQAEKIAEQDKAKGQNAGYAAGLASGKKGASSNSTTNGSDAYQDGFTEGYDKGYKEGSELLSTQKIAATDEGYKLGMKQEKISIPQKYTSIQPLKSSFQDGFNRARAAKDEEKKKEYAAQGLKDGKADKLNVPKNLKFINAYEQGYNKGQQELKAIYVKQGYNGAFQMITYKKPNFSVQKYVDWYKAGFKSNTKVNTIADAAYQAGLNGDAYKVPVKYSNAKPIYKYNYEKGAKDRKHNHQTAGGVIGLGLFGWLGRRFYVASKMIK